MKFNPPFKPSVKRINMSKTTYLSRLSICILHAIYVIVKLPILPYIFLSGAHTSISIVPFEFKTQWYTNISFFTQVWLTDEQLYIADLVFHSSEFLGHWFTYWTKVCDNGHGIVSTRWRRIRICKSINIKAYSINHQEKNYLIFFQFLFLFHRYMYLTCIYPFIPLY